MRRRNAWICCISITLVLAGYVAWCGRSFYLGLRVDTAGLPPEVAAEVTALAEKEGLLRPAPFRLDRFWHALCHPYAPRRQATLTVNREGSDGMVVTFFHATGHTTFRTSVQHFIRRAGRWRNVPREEYFHFKNRLPFQPWKETSPPRGPADETDRLISSTATGGFPWSTTACRGEA